MPVREILIACGALALAAAALASARRIESAVRSQDIGPSAWPTALAAGMAVLALVMLARAVLAARRRAAAAHTGDAHTGDARAGDARAGDARAGDARAAAARTGDARTGDARAADARAVGAAETTETVEAAGAAGAAGAADVTEAAGAGNGPADPDVMTGAEGGPDAVAPGGPAKVIGSLAAFAAYGAAWQVLDFRVCTPVLIAALAAIGGGRGWRPLIAFPVGVTAVLWLLFGALLEVPL